MCVLIHLCWSRTLFSATIQKTMEILLGFYQENQSDTNFQVGLQKYAITLVLFNALYFITKVWTLR